MSYGFQGKSLAKDPNQKAELINPVSNGASVFGIAFEPTPKNFSKNPSHDRLLVLPHAVSPHVDVVRSPRFGVRVLTIR